MSEAPPIERDDERPEAARSGAREPGLGFTWIPGGMLVAAAAAILLWWVWPPNEEVRGLGDDQGPAVDGRGPLPSYVLETDGGLTTPRADTGSDGPDSGPSEGPRHRYRRDSAFEWVLRPKVEAHGAVAVRGFAFVEGSRAGLALGLAKLVEITDTGVIQIHGKVGALELEPGRYSIALAVGRPGELPEQAADLLGADDDHAWAVRHVDVVIED
ncbi:hypothetical protein ENSA5_21410 [Enhygromyxa salina]|uniref:Uncharacterized protein n=1 Tax=Enhygromyxa salina TaxID=215803 RepID=A0A2S9YCD3_9BACT|nr:hypothetical protein [Enhygromyxa salina]PRQ02788.1 hypothetical protein ENSA5_21410 [Enhygromyxa salina]